ncbi:hypothetical protein Cylst_1237 [Cylindrospermum stagnale PCC 7417]|uniref:Cell division protein FtsL n=1 Tax=Cylindrospermum stagnale PCC 7417 TaxID=56107 RepID=K9WUQ4_9NOST|nr:hypothetical protein [Cylindrospermum stagnale]AFZ23534.1 hypothetical protein Cylst_1237 [Cylindrospermum stagnale PCC 7417]
MVVARKSAVSAKGNWFRRDSTLPLEKRRSARLGSSAQSAAVSSSETAPGTSKTQRRSLKDLAVSPTNGAVMATSVKELGKQQVSNIKAQSSVRLPIMSSYGSAPVWLLRLCNFNRYSSVVAFLLVATTLVVYGWTVYSQELWSQAYRKLQNLQRHERQLTTTNATLTNKMAEEAEKPTAGLVSPTPAGTIFLPPASHTSKPTSSNTTPNSEMQQQTLSPLGY